ncbi:MAG TPA: DUF4265 domain-containing protein [Terracidiphilus sp.]|jgi:hypothetical protein
MPDEERVKVLLRGKEPDEVEVIWATPLGSDLYRLENSPFYAYGVSWQDVIEAQPTDGTLEFRRVVEKSGHRTVRVILDLTSKSEPGKHVLDQIVDMGCTWEGMNTKLICIDLPASGSLDKTAKVLTAQQDVIWEYADPTYEEVTGEPPDLDDGEAEDSRAD